MRQYGVSASSALGTHKARRQRWVLLVTASLCVLLGQAACSGKSGPTKSNLEAELATVSPALAATLTAWPTPPPLITLPPTATAVPQPLWTAEPSPAPPQTGEETLPTAGAIPPTPMQPANETTAVPATAPGAALGTKPLAVRVLIPALGLDAPVVEVSWSVEFEGGTWRSVWQTADGAAGHLRNSANPGEAGNAVLSGHQNTRGEVFRQVSEVGQPGNAFGVGSDIILVAQDGARYTYAVVTWDRFLEEDASAEEQEEHAQYLAPTKKATLTLVTCWPYESNSHRVVVVAKLRP